MARRRLPTTSAPRGVPDAQGGRDNRAATWAARLSIAVGTALTLAAGSGAAWGDVPPIGQAATTTTADRSATAAVATRPTGAIGTTAGSTNAASARTGRHHTPARPSDPITTRIARASAAGEAIAERLTEARATLDTLTGAQTAAAADLAVAKTSTAAAEATASTWTRESFIAESGRPRGLVADPRTGMLGRPELGAAVRDLESAEAQLSTAADTARRASAAVAAQRAHVAKLQRDLDARGAELRRLRAARASALIEAQRERDAAEAALARRYLRDADGSAGKAASRAVEFALAQRGKPYEWGAEGPDRFDCSGLVQTAFSTAHVRLPRTARPQYRVAKPVSVTALLPGDLLFFATDHADWNTIHHVGVYLGRGLMVHAPTTGDVVRVAPVWWSEFFAAGRVVPQRRVDTSPAAGLRPGRPARPAPRPRTEAPRSAAPTVSPSVTTPADPATATPTSDDSKPTTPTASESPTATGNHTATPGRTAAESRTASGPTDPADPNAPAQPEAPRDPQALHRTVR